MVGTAQMCLCLPYAAANPSLRLALEQLSDGRNLDSLVVRRGRMRGIEQLFFAQTDRLKAF
jgi:hypothetical protein